MNIEAKVTDRLLMTEFPLIKKQIVINKILLTYYFNTLNSTNKEVLLLLHGWRSDSMAWLPVLKLLPPMYSYICLDLPGFGQSQIPPATYSLTNYAEIVTAFCRKLELDSLTLVGHSFGGRIAIKLAAKPSDWINKLVLVDSAGINSNVVNKNILKVGAKVVKPLFAGSMLQSLRTKIYKLIGSEDYVATPQLKQIFMNVIDEDLYPYLHLIKVKTLLLWGSNDKDTPIASADIMKKRIPNSTLSIIPEAGHYSFADQPIQFTEQLVSFIQSK